MNTPPAGIGTVRDFIGYGQYMPRVTWPNGANVAINLVVNYEEGSEYSFDRDGQNDVPVEAPYNFPLDTRDLSRESMYEYGSRAGIWRLMRLFDELGVPCTFYACAEAFEKNPEVAKYARAAGYDLLSHGNRWVEQWRFTREEEREQMKLAIKSFEGTWGERPRAWYCRYGASVNTRELVVEEGGFVYDSDAYNDDLPYYKTMGDHQQLVIPYSLTNNDLQGDKSPNLFSDYITRAFDELWREGENSSPKMMSVGLHPRTVGQPARANALREFIEHAQAKGKVWFARRMDIAEHWLEYHPCSMSPQTADAFAPKIRVALDQDWQNVVALSEFIHAHAEESSKEFDCSARLVAELETHGFDVQSGIAGLETAFRASFGASSATTTVAFVCEYDGLPPYGQSCGHNVVAAASYGAALALRSFAAELDLRLLVIGTPAEEGIGGKYILGDAGVFDDVDFAASIYPGMDDISASRTLAAQRLTIESFGKPAHGAAHPELGINALDGLVMGYAAMAMLRPTLPPTARVHGIINEGGIHPQVVPDYARATVVVRAADLTELADIRGRVTHAFQQGISAVGATCTVTPAERCAQAVLNIDALAGLFDAALRAVGRTPLPTDQVAGAWSTDAGALSRQVPYLQPQIKMTSRSIPPHSHAFHDASVGPDAESCIFDAAVALAVMAAEFASASGIREEVRSQFRTAVTGAS